MSLPVNFGAGLGFSRAISMGSSRGFRTIHSSCLRDKLEVDPYSYSRVAYKAP